jgi:uncharacterized protein YkwD
VSTHLPRAVLPTVLLALALTLVAPPAALAQTIDRYERQARVVTNNVRHNHDLSDLRKKPCVQRFAVRQARKMARQQRMFHQDLGVVMRRCNLDGVAENVAYGYDTGRRVVRAWMRSDGHRHNILNPGYRLIGMAARRGDNGSVYAAQVFGRR